MKVLPDGSLAINKVDSTMEGSYICEASNEIGTPLSKIIHVSVRGIMKTEQKAYKVFYLVQVITLVSTILNLFCAEQVYVLILLNCLLILIGI